GPAGDGDHAKPVLMQPVGDGVGRGAARIVQHFNSLAETPVRALRKDLLDRALADQQRLFTSPYDRDREPTSGEVERYLVHLLVAVVALDLVLHVGMRQHREVEEILEPRLEMAVEVGV